MALGPLQNEPKNQFGAPLVARGTCQKKTLSNSAEFPGGDSQMQKSEFKAEAREGESQTLT